MQPTLITISGVDIDSLVFLACVAFAMFSILLWVDYRKLKKAFVAFDLVVLTLVLGFLIGRFVYVIDNYSEFEVYGWSLLPMTETAQGVVFFKALPWSMFAFWDIGVYPQFLAAGFFVALGIMIWISSYTRSTKIKMINLAFRAFIPINIVLVLGFLLDASYVGIQKDFVGSINYSGYFGDRLAIQFFEILALLLVWALYFDSSKLIVKKFSKWRVILFPFLWTMIQVGSVFFQEGYSKDVYVFDIFQISWIIVLFCYLLFTSSLLVSSRSKTKEKEPDRKRVKRGRAITTGSYDISFANYKNSHSPRLSTRERLTQTKNRIRRGI